MNTSYILSMGEYYTTKLGTGELITNGAIQYSLILKELTKECIAEALANFLEADIDTSNLLFADYANGMCSIVEDCEGKPSIVSGCDTDFGYVTDYCFTIEESAPRPINLEEYFKEVE